MTEGSIYIKGAQSDVLKQPSPHQVGRGALDELARQPDVQGKCTSRRWGQAVGGLGRTSRGLRDRILKRESKWMPDDPVPSTVKVRQQQVPFAHHHKAPTITHFLEPLVLNHEA